MVTAPAEEEGFEEEGSKRTIESTYRVADNYALALISDESLALPTVCDARYACLSARNSVLLFWNVLVRICAIEDDKDGQYSRSSIHADSMLCMAIFHLSSDACFSRSCSALAACSACLENRRV